MGCQYTDGLDKDGNRIPRVLHQDKFVNETMRVFNMEDSHVAHSPMDPSILSTLIERNHEVDPTMATVPYRTAIGMLLYLAQHTRPDISTSVDILGRQIANPQRHHWTAVQRILRYVKGTSKYGIVLTPNERMILTASSDSG